MEWINIGGIDFLSSDIELLKKIFNGELEVGVDVGQETDTNENPNQTNHP